MKKFVFVYYDGGKQTSVTMEESMEAWGVWFKEIGESLVDGGNPFNTGGMSVTRDETNVIEAGNYPATGYTIVNAESIEAAAEIAKGCPMLAHTDGEGSVRVYEAMPM